MHTLPPAPGLPGNPLMLTGVATAPGRPVPLLYHPGSVLPLPLPDSSWPVIRAAAERLLAGLPAVP